MIIRTWCGCLCQSRFHVSVSALKNDHDAEDDKWNENVTIAEQLKAIWESLRAKVVEAAQAQAKVAEAAAAAGETALMKAERELEVASTNLKTKRQAYKHVDFTNEKAWNTARIQVEDVLFSMSTWTWVSRATGVGGAGGPPRARRTPQVC